MSAFAEKMKVFDASQAAYKHLELLQHNNYFDLMCLYAAMKDKDFVLAERVMQRLSVQEQSIDSARQKWLDLNQLVRESGVTA